MYRRPGDLRKSKARKRQMKPYLDKWTEAKAHDRFITEESINKTICRLDKNYRKKAPFAGWQSGADKELFHLDRLKKKNEHFMLDMSEWSKWDELAFQEECDRLEREEYDSWMMEEEMQWMAQDYFDDQLDEQYLDDDRWWADWDYPDDDDWRNDKGCDCPECNPSFYLEHIDPNDPYVIRHQEAIKRMQIDKLWAEHKTAQQEEEALAVAECCEMDPDELAEYYYQLQL